MDERISFNFIEPPINSYQRLSIRDKPRPQKGTRGNMDICYIWQTLTWALDAMLRVLKESDNTWINRWCYVCDKLFRKGYKELYFKGLIWGLQLIFNVEFPIVM